MFKVFVFYFILSFFLLFKKIYIFLHFYVCKEVTFAWISSNQKFLKEKKNQAWKSNKKYIWLEKKSKKAYHEREDTKKLCFPWLQKNIIFIGDATYKGEIVFQKKKNGKQPIKDKPYIY